MFNIVLTFLFVALFKAGFYLEFIFILKTDLETYTFKTCTKVRKSERKFSNTFGNPSKNPAMQYLFSITLESLVLP